MRFEITIGLIGIVAVIAACATIGPAKPDPSCTPSALVRDSDGFNGHTVNAGRDCYECVGAQSCSPHGNDWCCADSSCSECEPPMIPGMFGVHAPDGGA